MSVTNHTADADLQAYPSGSLHTNWGALGPVTLTLPGPAPVGTEYLFAVATAQQLRIDPGPNTILDNSGQTASRYKWADAIGECFRLVKMTPGQWAVTGKYGVWTEEV